MVAAEAAKAGGEGVYCAYMTEPPDRRPTKDPII